MSIPYTFLQGNRSEYLAIPALTKLGFTIPVPREKDHFGVDFIVHLACLDEKNIISAVGRSFAIQIKSNKNPITFNKQRKINCLYNSAIPFFLGVVSREDLTLTIYNTLGRLCFFWMKGKTRPFKLIPKSTGEGLKAPDYENGKVWTGKPILKISIKDPSSTGERLKEIHKLQKTMDSWIILENQILSLKEQDVPIVLRPQIYSTNEPLELSSTNPNKFERVAYFNPKTLPNICVAAEKTLDSLSCYLKDCLERFPQSFDEKFKELITNQFIDVQKVRKQNQEIISKMRRTAPRADRDKL